MEFVRRQVDNSHSEEGTPIMGLGSWPCSLAPRHTNGLPGQSVPGSKEVVFNKQYTTHLDSGDDEPTRVTRPAGQTEAYRRLPTPRFNAPLSHR